MFRVYLSAFALTCAVIARADDPAAFFEKEVQPLLRARCYECHSHEGKVKGGLVLDSRAGWEQGGDSGPAIAPGAPEKSLLIRAVRYADQDLTMPPKKKLSDAEIAVLERWVNAGAPDPRVANTAAKKTGPGMSLAEARSYWAFQPLAQSPPPSAGNAIDAFVRDQLAKNGLQPNPPASPRMLMRRLYFDLLGLPPTYDEVETFAADPSPAACQKLIDHLLARPEYGQRWARHWLDVARYSDTTENSTDGERRIPFAHTYRDYVVDAFNADKPFNEFVVEQIAADRLPAEARPDLRALGFLTVGRRFIGNIEAPQLIIDDRIDTIGRGFLGLTLACARCHDHKFDAIPAADYYSLYGILASSTEPMDLPEVAIRGPAEAVEKYRTARAQLFAEYEKHIDACVEKARRLLRELAPEYLRFIVDSSPNHRTVEGFIPLDTPRGLLVRGGAPRWSAFIAETLRQGQPFFRLWPRLLELPRAGFAEKARALLDEAAACPDQHDPLILATFAGQSPATMLEVADLYGKALEEVLKTPARATIGALLASDDSPLQFSREEIREDLLRFVTEHQLVSRPDGEAAGKMREKLTVLEATAPVERALAVSASPQPFDAHVMLRGDRHKLGAATPRRFLQALATVDARTYADDGRLEFAQAIAHPQNPLTARVIANRIWQHHFGHGLVGTPDNFGAMGERPSHPELLDHLAGWFIEHGWSIKALHRYILTSATWQQSSEPQPRALERDPANRLLWRTSPRRLEFEPLRDSILTAAGRLDTHLGGVSAPLKDTNYRRALYGYTDRFRLPALLRNFDVANPDTSISQRAETVHALQALYFLNSPFVRAQAESIAARSEFKNLADPRARITALYRQILSRSPDEDEQRFAAEFLSATPTDRQWSSFAQTLLLSNEFAFYD
jgi:cytochrome c553